MLSYQHIYHAGNFADVQKHSVLIGLIKALKKEHSALNIIDTHAGRGVYNLKSKEAKKTQEYIYGIEHFWTMRSEKTPLSDYLNFIEKNNRTPLLQSYAGSAKILSVLLRKEDTLTLAEMHPQEILYLQESITPAKNIYLKKEDGFALLKEDNFDLVIIDPSYEVKSEYDDVINHIKQLLRKSPNACILLWYPLLKAGLHSNMVDKIKKLSPAICGEIILEQQIKENFAMYGSGLVILNPPKKFEDAFDKINKFIAKRLPIKAEYKK